MLFIYITRLASNEIFSPSNKIHREVGRAKDLSAPPPYSFPSKRIIFYIVTLMQGLFKVALEVNERMNAN